MSVKVCLFLQGNASALPPNLQQMVSGLSAILPTNLTNAVGLDAATSGLLSQPMVSQIVNPVSLPTSINQVVVNDQTTSTMEEKQV